MRKQPRMSRQSRGQLAKSKIGEKSSKSAVRIQPPLGESMVGLWAAPPILVDEPRNIRYKTAKDLPRVGFRSKENPGCNEDRKNLRIVRKYGLVECQKVSL